MKFLVVDDDPSDRALVVRELRRAFPEAEFEEVGRRADFEAALARGGFQVVLTDYSLRWADGLWVLQRVRGRDARLPVIMVTGTDDERVAAEGMRAGLSGYVLKDCLHRLPGVVRESLERARLRREL